MTDWKYLTPPNEGPSAGEALCGHGPEPVLHGVPEPERDEVLHGVERPDCCMLAAGWSGGGEAVLTIMESAEPILGKF